MHSETSLKCCFTGYRPSKMPFDFLSENEAYKQFENSLYNAIMRLIGEGCTLFYTGMAMGFDIVAAETVLEIKKISKTPIELVCVLPFPEQADSFSEDWKQRYYNILNNADSRMIISQEYSKGCYQKRNIYMVDNADYILTWFDGRSGGTKNTIDYARKKGRYVININEDLCENLSIFDDEI